MKREEILFYIATGKIFAYLLGSKKELVEQVDTSLFFSLGEISNVCVCAQVLSKLVAKMNFGLYYLKPNVTVLYNDVCASDAKFLYRHALLPVGYNKIRFVPITKLVKKIKDDENLVIRDGDYYTVVNRKEKCVSLDDLDFEPIVIGGTDKKHIHFSDDEIIWKTFKSCFTKGKSYGIIDIGDDYV